MVKGWLRIALEMRGRGVSFQAIADHLGYSQSYVHKAIKKYEYGQQRLKQIGGSKVKLVIEAYFMRPRADAEELAKQLHLSLDQVTEILNERNLQLPTGRSDRVIRRVRTK